MELRVSGGDAPTSGAMCRSDGAILTFFGKNPGLLAVMMRTFDQNYHVGTAPPLAGQEEGGTCFIMSMSGPDWAWCLITVSNPASVKVETVYLETKLLFQGNNSGGWSGPAAATSQRLYRRWIPRQHSIPRHLAQQFTILIVDWWFHYWVRYGIMNHTQ